MANLEKSTTKRRKVTFHVDAPHAHQVSLVGDFNDWNPARHPMSQNGDGCWRRSVFLAPGAYQYKFKVDDAWQEDPVNKQRCCNPFGTKNSIIFLND